MVAHLLSEQKVRSLKLHVVTLGYYIGPKKIIEKSSLSAK